MLLMTVLAAAAAPAMPPADCPGAAPAFMAAYAADISRGDRGAIARRYSRSGATTLGFGPKSNESYNAIVQRYAGAEWQKPDRFGWNDLGYMAVGPGTCLVTGGFDWTVGPRTAHMAYTGLLKREGGEWRIVLEHESMLPPSRQK